MTDLDSLLGALRAAPDLTGNACHGAWELFDATIRSGPGRVSQEVAEARQEALQVCDTCPALIPCRTYVERLPTHLRPPGVVAGLVIDKRSTRTVA
jgi:WhiB family redox-sensing transcriptional regulator